MPTIFRHSLVTQIGTVPTDVVSIAAGTRATVIGCNLANVTDYDTVVANVEVVGADTTVAKYATGVVIPPHTSVKVITHGEKLILPENTGLRITTDTTDGIDATISYVEIS